MGRRRESGSERADPEVWAIVERAAAIIIATVGILILTIAAVFWVQSRDVRSPPAVALDDGVARLDADTTGGTGARRATGTPSGPVATAPASSARSPGTTTSIVPSTNG